MDIFEDYGYAIAGDADSMRDVSEILAELEEIQENFSTHSMSTSGQAFLQGKAEMLSEVIQYLRRV